MRCVERTGSFIVNLILCWVMLLIAYEFVTGGQYPSVPLWFYFFVKLLFFVFPVLAIALLINRNWLRKAKWVDDVVIPEIPFYLSNYESSKLVFNEDHLRFEPRFLLFPGKVRCIGYGDIERIELITTSGVQGCFIIYVLVLNIKDSDLKISVDGYNTLERVMILKALKKKCPASKYNEKAEMYMAGYFLRRVSPLEW